MGSLFKLLMDATTSVAYALTRITVGLALDATRNGLLAFVFKDKDGNAVIPQLNPEGAIVVALDAGDTKRVNGSEVKANLTKNVEALVAELTILADKTYTKPSIIYSCFRDLKFRVALVDDADGTPVETNIYEGVLGGAEVYEDIALKQDIFDTIGGTGTQKILFYATPLDNPDDIYVQASVNEVA
jgi:hypothetical protein